MIIQEKVKYIIMLTNFIEKGYTKSTPYFPSEANKTDNYNGVTVKCLTVSLKFSNFNNDEILFNDPSSFTICL